MSLWHPFPAKLECQAGQIYIVGISYDAHFNHADYIQFLSPTEKERAARFKFSRHRERFIFFHARLRDILAKCLPCAPEALTFYEGAQGKPYLDKKYELQFNLSHSDDEAIIAISKNAEIGVDIEKIDDKKSVDEIAERFFSPLEYAYLSGLSANEKVRAFFQFWTLKEAFIKATGKGLSQELKRFSMELNPARLITADDYHCDEWTVHSFTWKIGFMSAFATQQTNSEIHFYTDHDASLGIHRV